MLWPAARFVQHGQYILKCLDSLAGEVRGLKARFFIPADLACNENLRADCRDAIRITARLDPAGGEKSFFMCVAPR